MNNGAVQPNNGIIPTGFPRVDLYHALSATLHLLAVIITFIANRAYAGFVYTSNNAGPTYDKVRFYVLIWWPTVWECVRNATILVIELSILLVYVIAKTIMRYFHKEVPDILLIHDEHVALLVGSIFLYWLIHKTVRARRAATPINTIDLTGPSPPSTPPKRWTAMIGGISPFRGSPTTSPNGSPGSTGSPSLIDYTTSRGSGLLLLPYQGFMHYSAASINSRTIPTPHECRRGYLPGTQYQHDLPPTEAIVMRLKRELSLAIFKYTNPKDRYNALAGEVLAKMGNCQYATVKHNDPLVNPRYMAAHLALYEMVDASRFDHCRAYLGPYVSRVEDLHLTIQSKRDAAEAQKRKKLRRWANKEGVPEPRWEKDDAMGPATSH